MGAVLVDSAGTAVLVVYISRGSCRDTSWNASQSCSRGHSTLSSKKRMPSHKGLTTEPLTFLRINLWGMAQKRRRKLQCIAKKPKKRKIPPWRGSAVSFGGT